MRVVTWSRDSHGLFDYESKEKDRQQNEFKTTSGIVVMRSTQTGAITLDNPAQKKNAAPN